MKATQQFSDVEHEAGCPSTDYALFRQAWQTRELGDLFLSLSAQDRTASSIFRRRRFLVFYLPTASFW